jgi:sulfur carrier protein
MRSRLKPFEPDPGNAGGGKQRTGYIMPAASAAVSVGDDMRITVNGESVDTDAATLLGYLDSIGIDPVRVALELNLDIVPKKNYAVTALSAGDRIEIVQFVGGG